MVESPEWIERRHKNALSETVGKGTPNLALEENLFVGSTGAVFADGPEAWSATLENTSTDTLIVIVQLNTLTDLDNALEGELVLNSTDLPADTGEVSLLNSTTATDTVGDMQVVADGGEAELDGDTVIPFTWSPGSDEQQIPYVLGPGENIGVTSNALEDGTLSSADLNAAVSIVYYEVELGA